MSRRSGWRETETLRAADAWQKIGVMTMRGAVDWVTAMLARPLRTYRDFARDTAEQWRSA